MKTEKTFAIESLFEGPKYVTIYDDKTGEEIGRIYGQGKKFLAKIISTGREETLNKVSQAKEWILKFAGVAAQREKREVIKWELWKVNEHGQRKHYGTFLKSAQMHYAKQNGEKHNPGYSFQVESVYRPEDKSQVQLFA